MRTQMRNLMLGEEANRYCRFHYSTVNMLKDEDTSDLMMLENIHSWGVQKGSVFR